MNNHELEISWKLRCALENIGIPYFTAKDIVKYLPEKLQECLLSDIGDKCIIHSSYLEGFKDGYKYVTQSEVKLQ